MSPGDVSSGYKSDADGVARDFGYDRKVSSFGPDASREQFNRIPNSNTLTGRSDGGKLPNYLVFFDL